MNFLAHQYLSFHNSEIQLGNLYGEIVRGKDYLHFEKGLQNGILLHREIDTFTDAHDLVKNSTQKFHEKYGKYAPVIVDVLYDYLLIKNWETYSQVPFDQFVQDCYALFSENFETFPPKLQFIIQHLLEHDWFHNYTSIEGISQTLKGISQRSKFKNNIEESTHEFLLFEQDLQEDFQIFFPELISHCKLFIAENQ
ncbi:acyl carrier protein phosphodiesterase [Moheibacter lacus]|uniref:DUF479 domain-containing protein n=1 Tax=Moheibacter lacus TaxID=2745851 RepID=A0A838ZF61_9FLAO|nr:acyl carrier protein phosphodiesterase [Moheibacter lacus]MBA5628371.1 DUF479 domain-containing protein [Moheibacter lacus]